MAFEKWLPVVGYESLYEVSDFGNVRRIEGVFYWRPTGKILRNQLTYDGYSRVFLSKTKDGGRKKWEFVHCLVMAAFVGPKLKGYDVDHKDRNRSNNDLSNLSYLYHKENKFKKLSHAKVTEIRRLYFEGFSQIELAEQFGIKQPHVSRIVNFISRKWNFKKG
jgi:hypothetical protein